MGSIAYTVTTTLPDEDARAKYIAWLEDGHVDAVIEGGAHSAMIVVIEDPATPLTVQTRYIFSTRADLDRYLTHHAPALREDGMRRFGPETGVRFERQIGRVV